MKNQLHDILMSLWSIVKPICKDGIQMFVRAGGDGFKLHGKRPGWDWNPVSMQLSNSNWTQASDTKMP